MTLTDELLRHEIAQGLTAPQIAAKYGISKQAVYKRVNRLELTTTTVAVMAPLESRRFVNSQVDILEELAASLSRVKLLMDACDRYLRDADDPARYDIGPRGHEVEVTVNFVGDNGRPHFVKRSLQEWIRRIEQHEMTEGSEYKIADPRETILKTAQEVRQTVMAAAQLADMLAKAQGMQKFREALLAAIAQVSPDVATAIADALRPVLAIHAATN